MEFRDTYKELLRPFRRSMLQYAGELNSQIKDLDRAAFESKTRFFIETKIVPILDELREAMNRPAVPGYRRAIGGVKIVGSIGAALVGVISPLAAIFTSVAGHVFDELSAKANKEEAIKRAGLAYLLRLQQFHDERQ
jgi:hypothetical protein